MQLGDLGERCKLPQRGLGRSPSRNRIWCILALKYDIYLVATILMIFLRINRPNFVQLNAYQLQFTLARTLRGPKMCESHARNAAVRDSLR